MPRRRPVVPPPVLAPERAADPGALDALRAVAHAAVAADRVDEALAFGLERLTAAVGGPYAAVFVVQGDDDLLRLAAAHNWPARVLPWLAALEVRVGEGPGGEAVAERRAIELDDVLTAPGIEAWRGVLDELGVRAIAAYPLLVEGTAVGAALWCFRDAAQARAVDRRVLRTGVDLLATAWAVGRWRDRARRAEAALAEARAAQDDAPVARRRSASELAGDDASGAA